MLARGNLERLANLDNQASASSIAALQMLDRCCSLHHLLRWRQCEAVIIFLAVGYYLIAQFDQDAKFSTGDCPASADTSESILPEKYLPIQNPDGDFISVAMAQELLAANYIYADETSVRINPKGREAKNQQALFGICTHWFHVVLIGSAHPESFVPPKSRENDKRTDSQLLLRRYACFALPDFFVPAKALNARAALSASAFPSKPR